MDVGALIGATKKATQDGQDKVTTTLAIDNLAVIISEANLPVESCVKLVCFRASLQIQADRASYVIEELGPRVQPGGDLVSYPYAHNTYADALRHVGRLEQAEAHLTARMGEGELLEHDPVAHDLRANIKIRDGRAAEAAIDLVQVIDEFTEDSYIDNTYAHALIEADCRWEADAISHLEPLIQEGGRRARNPISHRLYAKALICAGHLKAAEAHLTALIVKGGLLEDDTRAINMVYDIRRRFAGKRRGSLLTPRLALSDSHRPESCRHKSSC